MRSGIPDWPRVTLKPNFSSWPVRYFDVSTSCMPELAEAEDRVDHFLRELRHFVHALDGLVFLSGQPRLSGGAAGGRRRGLSPGRRSSASAPSARQRISRESCVSLRDSRHHGHRIRVIVPAGCDDASTGRAPIRPGDGRAGGTMPCRAVTAPLPPFSPVPRWAGGHKMTLYAWARRAALSALPPPEVALLRRRARRARAGALPLAARSAGASDRRCCSTASRAPARRTTSPAWPTRPGRAASTSCGSTSATAAAPNTSRAGSTTRG